MGIKRDLKKEGIEIVKQIDTLKVNAIAKNVADKLSKTFPELGANSNQLFMKLSRLNMYFAKLPRGINAKYYYKNKSIYFADDLKEENLVSVAVHECIHYLQERYDKSGEVIKLGLCDYTDGDLPGTGINEAAVQLMASKCIENPYENVKYFDIDISTNTPTYYTLECALVRQMAYVVGEDVLFDSTLNANSNFKEQFISFTSKKVFFNIQKNIDMLVETQANLEKVYSDLQEFDGNVAFAKKCGKEINKLKGKIKELFLETQKLIICSYFDNAINLAYKPKMIENYRNKLYYFKDLIGQVEGDNFYNDYYINKMVQIEDRYNIDAEDSIKDLVVVKKTFWSTLIRKIKMLFGLNPDYYDIKSRM